METQGFIQLPPGGAQQRAGGNPALQGRIPPPPPMQPGGGRPQIVNAVPPQAMQQQMMQRQQMMMMPPRPNQELVPAQFQSRANPLVQVSDIRRERMTEDEAREELSDYLIYRFEKIDEGSGYDSDGEKKKSTWENCYRTEVRDLSKKEASRQVKHLNRSTIPISEKKQTLSTAQQRQLERVLEELMARERDPRFQVTLNQLDFQFKPVSKEREWELKEAKYGLPYYSKSEKRYYFKSAKGRHLSTSPKGDKEKKKIERISITAYYKRSPRPEISAIAILTQRENQQRQALQPPQPNVVHMQQQQQQQMPRSPMPGGQRPSMPAGVQVVNGQREKKYSHQGRDRGSSTSSNTSSFDSDFSDSDSNASTPNSSLSSGRHSLRRKKEKRYIEGPGHYGIKNGALAPHKHRHHEEHRLTDEMHRLPSSPPRLSPGASPDLIEQIKAEAYAAGRVDEREDVRELIAEQRVANAARLPPRIIQRKPSIRRVNAGEVALQLEADALDREARERELEALDRLERLRFDDDIGAGARRPTQYVDSLDEAIALAERRRVLQHEERLERIRLQQEEDDALLAEQLLQEDLERERMERLERSREYQRRRESAADVFVNATANPFAPRPDLRDRRYSAAPFVGAGRRYDF